MHAQRACIKILVFRALTIPNIFLDRPCSPSIQGGWHLARESTQPRAVFCYQQFSYTLILSWTHPLSQTVAQQHSSDSDLLFELTAEMLRDACELLEMLQPQSRTHNDQSHTCVWHLPRWVPQLVELARCLHTYRAHIGAFG